MSKQLARQTVSRFVLSLLVISLTTLTAGSLHAQNAAAYEYMTASSPLKNGWTVTSQTIPGRPISTVVTPGPVNAAGTNVTLTPTSMQTPTPTVTNPPAYTQSYVPASTPPVGNWVWVPNNGMGMTPGGVPVVTQPTLGITSNNSFKPPVAAAPANCQCQPNGTVATVPPYTAPPYTTGVPTIPFAPSAPLPGTVPNSYTTSASGPANAASGAVAPAGAAPTTAYYPYLTGDFQPIVATQNMPPGTYLGRGLIGQPTAYVDGQPVRNLFRYIFP
ncbi:MAG: hypothetical protein ACKO81_13065 [Planctomycetota bacterium]